MRLSLALFSFDHNIGKPKAKKESNFFFFAVLCRAFELNSSFSPIRGALADLVLQKSECPRGRSVVGECAVLEMADALKQTLPTCASRNIRKTVWKIYISIVDLKSLRTCFYPTGLFKLPVNDRTVLVPVNEGITYISLFLELEEADFLRQQWMCSFRCVQWSLLG